MLVTKEASIHEFFFSRVFEFMSQVPLALAADMNGSDLGLPKCRQYLVLIREAILSATTDFFF
jgi:hypothetical protein